MTATKRWRSASGGSVGDFEHDVFPAELREIDARREAVGQPPVHPGGDARPHAGRGLIGLALSGGGIRSATYSLGAIQALDHCSVFKSIDYLSTVSGGGFIGGCVSSLMNDPGVRPNDRSFPLHSGLGAKESAAVRHIRNSGHYLAPGGLLDRMRIPAIFLRGVVMNAVALVPILVAFVIATQMYVDYDPDAAWPRRLLTIGVVLFAISELAAKHAWRKWTSRNRVEGWFSFSLLVALLGALMPWLLQLVKVTREPVTN